MAMIATKVMHETFRVSKLFVALIASVRLFTRMKASVAYQMRTLSECLAAELANIGLLSGM